MRRPNFFIVGAPKCGTTSMYAYLGGHPEVFMPEIKEPNFFADDLEIRSYPEIESEEDYLALYRPSRGERILGDASQFHLYSKVAARRISSFSPRAKILIMLREPISLMRSLHEQYLSTFDEDVRDFAEVVALEADRLRGDELPPRSLFPRCMAYLDQATLSPQVERYLEAFPRDDIRVVLLDDLRRSTSDVLAETLTFLGLSGQSDLDLTPRNVSPNRAPLDEDLERRLRQHFSVEIDRLERLLDRDLSAWRSPGSRGDSEDTSGQEASSSHRTRNGSPS